MRIALVAGEASGDLLGAGLVASLRQYYPDAEFVGIGGPQMRAVGVETWWDCSELAVMGLFEVLRHLPRLLRLRAQLRQRLLQQRPDVFIGIDAPDLIWHWSGSSSRRAFVRFTTSVPRFGLAAATCRRVSPSLPTACFVCFRWNHPFTPATGSTRVSLGTRWQITIH